MAASSHAMSTERLYTVDRIEAGSTVLVDEDGITITIPGSTLPSGSAEGIVLRVPMSTAGQPRWEGAQVDHAETERRRAEADERLARLKRRDPGGDLRI